MAVPHCLIFQITEYSSLSRSLGAHRIASYLRQNDWDAEVIDWANHWNLEQLIQLFNSRYNSQTKFIAFSHLFSIWDDTAENFCGWVKSKYPDLIIISGSAVLPLFTTKHIDYYLQGFGEHALMTLLKWLFANGTRPRFDLQKINGKPVIKANDTYPAFPMSSMLVTYEKRDFIRSNEWLTIETARGCKFQCKFCNFPVLGVKGDYSRDADDFELQLKDTFEKFGVTNYIIADETFNDRTEKISKFADVVEKLDWKPWFSAFIRADLMVGRPQDREELLRMRVLGHLYGVESFNTKSARTIGKGMDSEKLKAGLIDCKKYFQTHSVDMYRGSISLILGLPYETFDSLETTRQWLLANWLGQSYIVYALDIPDHELHSPSEFSIDAKKYGYTRIADKDLMPDSVNVVKQIFGQSVMMWQNDHMNVYQARDLADKWIEQKYSLDFRPTAFTLARRLKNDLDIQKRLTLDNRQFSRLIDPDISEYINCKLNWN